LEDADLKPHRSVYWLNSHAPAFEAKARDICQLYGNALRFYRRKVAWASARMKRLHADLGFYQFT